MLRFVTADGADPKRVQVVQGIVHNPGAGCLIGMFRIAGGEFVDVYAQESGLRVALLVKRMVVGGAWGGPVGRRHWTSAEYGCFLITL